MALAMLARDWAEGRDGRVLALVVDHGLRSASGVEAAQTCGRLDALGVQARLLRLQGLARGPGLAARARDARHAALQTACAEAGILHLLLGHHALDQAETMMMRLLRGSGPDGLAGMAALAETHHVRVLRPLLAAAPGALRATLRAVGVEWVEDPSNADQAALRTRLRLALADPEGAGHVVRAHAMRAAALGAARRAREAAAAAWLGRHARLHPAGFGVLLSLPPWAGPLSALIRAVAGGRRAPAPESVSAWLAKPRAATLSGVVLRPAGRLAPSGWLLARELAAVRHDVVGECGIWDGRLRHRAGSASAVSPPSLVARSRPGSAASEGNDDCDDWVWWPAAPVAGAGFLPSEAAVGAGMHKLGPQPML